MGIQHSTLLVIGVGVGVGGYITAIRAAQLGIHVEGACIDTGQTVDVAQDKADTKPVRIQGEHIVLATGSVELGLPGMPFGGRVISSTQALSPDSIPKELVVVGGGYIGLELGLVYRKLGVQVLLGNKVQGLNSTGDAVRVLDGSGRESELAADQVLVAIGRVPHTHGWGLEGLMLAMNGRAIKVDDQCRTSMRNVWTIGDLTGEPMLAHRAMAQGEMVAEITSASTRSLRTFPWRAGHRCGRTVMRRWMTGCTSSQTGQPTGMGRRNRHRTRCFKCHRCWAGPARRCGTAPHHRHRAHRAGAGRVGRHVYRTRGPGARVCAARPRSGAVRVDPEHRHAGRTLQ